MEQKEIQMKKSEAIKTMKDMVRGSEEFAAVVAKFDGVQIGADEFALVVPIDGKERFVTVKLVAKNEDFDVFGEGGAVETWEFTQKQLAEKAEERERKAAAEADKRAAREAKAKEAKA